MDPLAVAGTFATIVGLLADFTAHRADNQSADLPEFLEWLRFHGHAELKALIEKNHATATHIKAALAEDHDALLSKLLSIERTLAMLCENHGPLGTLAVTLRPETRISDQAIQILLAFERAGAGSAFEVHSYEFISLTFADVSAATLILPTGNFIVTIWIGWLQSNCFD